jgi:hypothetical protein
VPKFGNDCAEVLVGPINAKKVIIINSSDCIAILGVHLSFLSIITIALLRVVICLI